MIKLDKKTQDAFIELYKEDKILLEGNILRFLDSENNEEFKKYLDFAVESDKNNRKKRLDITKQLQQQNRELSDTQNENLELMSELKTALAEAENAKKTAEEDLDLLQKKTQTELIGSIVKVALWVIIGVGVTTTGLYGIILANGTENKIVESTWSNLLGILLTNSFSIIGTIMGIKYASEKS